MTRGIDAQYDDEYPSSVCRFPGCGKESVWDSNVAYCAEHITPQPTQRQGKIPVCVRCCSIYSKGEYCDLCGGKVLLAQAVPTGQVCGFPGCNEGAVGRNSVIAYCAKHLGSTPTSYIQDVGSTFVKHDKGKLRYILLPPKALKSEVEVLEFGARKYSADNWRKVPAEKRVETYLNAAYRHLEAYRAGEVNDPESGLPHLACARCSLGFLLELDLIDLESKP